MREMQMQAELKSQEEKRRIMTDIVDNFQKQVG